MIGAGPYGLSTAAHLGALGVPYEIFGEPFSYWREHMPEGMHLKSSWAASSIASPGGRLSLASFARRRGEAVPRPVSRTDFLQYGAFYQAQAVPQVDHRRVVRLERIPGGFVVDLSDGSQRSFGRVVLATGLGEFAYRPPEFGALPPYLVSHTSEHRRLDRFAGSRLCVVGAGQSALECAVLAHEAGAVVDVVVRAPEVHWLLRKAALDGGPGRWLYAPSDVGPAGLSWAVAAPELMRRLPWDTRQQIVARCLRPAVTAWLNPRAASVRITRDRRITRTAVLPSGELELLLSDGSAIRADHLLLGTGFRPDLGSVSLLGPDLRTAVRVRDGLPVLGRGFESSVPGLHVVGALAAGSFGPVMRFVSGTWYAAPAVARQLAASVRRA